MVKKRRKRKTKRGYPIAVIIAFEESSAFLWQVYSEVVRHFSTIELGRKTKNSSKQQRFQFYESLVSILRPILKLGVRSVILVSNEKEILIEFQDYLKKHHGWLVRNKGSNTITIGTLIGSAKSITEVNFLIENEEFKKILEKTISLEANRLIDIFEKLLNSPNGEAVIEYSLAAIETIIYADNDHEKKKNHYLVLTDNYLAVSKAKQRIYRLMQVSENKGIIVKIIKDEGKARNRINQFGGVIYFCRTL